MKQNQVVALVKDRKEDAKKALTAAHHAFQKADLFSGLLRTYRPRQEDEAAKPQEVKRLQATVRGALADLQPSMAKAFDTVLTQDVGNIEAIADVVVGDKLKIDRVPVTHLMFLEKQLVDLCTFVQGIPTLDPTEEWSLDGATGQYRSKATESLSTRKVQKPLVLYQATEQHPAQTQLITEDVPVGVWETVKFSGAIPLDQKKAMLARATAVLEAVRSAREIANQTEVSWQEEGNKILSFIFGA